MPIGKEEKKWDIHHRDKKYERAMKALKDSKICKENKDLILRFVRHKRIGENLSVARQTKYLHYMRILAELLEKPFDRATPEDIEKLLEKVYNRPVKRGETIKEASPWTKRDMAILLKTFYRWLKKTDKPKETEWIKPMTIEDPVLGPDDLLTWEDIEAMGRVSMNLRDEAFVKVLWESGCRIGELLSLRICDIEQKGKGVVIRLRESKTKKRKILLVRSAGFLIRYRNSHPHKEDKTYPLWINLQTHKQLDYAAAAHAIKRLAKKAKLNKPVNPHTFRKSAATYYSRYLSPAELKSRFGWKQSSKMLDIYLHPDEEEVNKRILEIEGVEEKEKPKVRFKSCHACGTLNPLDAENCCLCGDILDAETSYLSKRLVWLVDELIKEKGGYDKLFNASEIK